MTPFFLNWLKESIVYILKTFVISYRDVQMSARARLVMKPTTKQVPFVGGLQFCFLTIPQIGFDLDGIADIIDWAPLKRKVCVFDRKLFFLGPRIMNFLKSDVIT